MITAKIKEKRQKGLGGSEVAAIYGCHPYLTQMRLWARKKGKDNEETETIATSLGNYLERFIAKIYEKETGRPVVQATSKDYVQKGILIGNVDGFTEDEHTKMVWEAKTTFDGSSWKEGCPEHYWIQLQHYLYLHELEKASISVLIGNRKFLWQDVQRDDEFLKHHPQKCKEWWERYIVGDEIPPADHRDYDLIDRIYQVSSGSSIIGDEVMMKLAREYDEIAAEIKRLTKEKENLALLVKERLQDKELLLLPDGSAFKWKLEERKEYVVPASSSRVLRRIKKGG